jgi:hypothetical protein
MPDRLPRLRSIFILVLSIALLASGCNGAGATPSIQPTSSGLSPQPETPDVLTVIPSDTPAPARVWLVVQSGTAGDYVDGISAKLSELAAQSGYSFEQIETLSESDLKNARAVFWYGDPADFNRLTASAPQTPFVLIGSAGAKTAANVSQILLSPARVSFVAGLVAILTAPDRRAGGLFSADDPLHPQRIDAFNNGARYLCGRCVPVYAPVFFFPVTSAVAGGQSYEAWKVAFDQLDQNRIESLYLPPEGASREMLDYLAGQSVVVVGSAAPPEGYSSIWAATVDQNPAAALETLWPDLFSAEAAGKTIDAPIVLRDINDLILTPGRRSLVERIAAELTAGWIEPLSVP